MYQRRITVTGNDIVEQFDTGFIYFSVRLSTDISNIEATDFAFTVDNSTSFNVISFKISGITFQLRIANSKSIDDAAWFVYKNGERIGPVNAPALMTFFEYYRNKSNIIIENTNEKISDNIYRVGIRFAYFGSGIEKIPKRMNFFIKKGENDNLGLINGKSNTPTNLNVEGEEVKIYDNPEFQYLIRNQEIHNITNPFLWLSVFLGFVKNSTVADKNLIDFGDRNISFTNNSIRAPRRKSLMSSELLAKYRVFYLKIENILNNALFKNDERNSTKPTALGSVDYLPLVFDSFGNKIPQKNVCFIRNIVGNSLFILIPRSIQIYNTLEIGTVILQPKTLYNINNHDICESLPDREINNDDGSLKIKFIVDSNNNPVDFDKYILVGKTKEKVGKTKENNFLPIDPAMYFLHEEKENISHSTNEGKSITKTNPITLVSRRRDYNKDISMQGNSQFSSTIPSPGERDEFVKNRNIFATLLYKSDTFSEYHIVNQNSLKDYYSSIDSFKKDIKNINTGELQIDSLYYIFDYSNSSLQNGALYQKVEYQGSNKEMFEIIPKFHGRRTLPILGTTNSDQSNYHFNIKGYELSQKIISDYEYSEGEYDIFVNNLFKGNEKIDASWTSGQTFELFYSYGTRRDTVRLNADSYYNGVTVQQPDIKQRDGITGSFTRKNYIFSDPEALSFYNDENESMKTREVFLYDKENFTSKLLEVNEPVYTDSGSSVLENRYTIGGLETNAASAFSEKLKNLRDSYSNIRSDTMNNVLATNLKSNISNMVSRLDHLKDLILNTKTIVSTPSEPINSNTVQISESSYSAVKFELDSDTPTNLNVYLDKTLVEFQVCRPNSDGTFLYVPADTLTATVPSYTFKFSNSNIKSYQLIK